MKLEEMERLSTYEILHHIRALERKNDKEIIDRLLSLKADIELDENTVVKNFPSSAVGYRRCKMLIDEAVSTLEG